MKHLMRFNESNGKKLHNPTLGELLNTLQVALDGMFIINIGGGSIDNHRFIRVSDVSDFDKYYLVTDDTYIEINGDDGTYIDFTLNNFSISELKRECNNVLDKGDDISDDSGVVDKYEFLCQTILVTLDSITGEISQESNFIKVSDDWSYICYTLGVSMDDDVVDRVRRLMDRYNLVKK
jgi:uncharacterized protein (UPF0248 family)